MKVAAVIEAAEDWNRRNEPPRFAQTLVHTGQHYDEKMSRVFFDDLGLPRPDYDLEVGSGSHGQQTARVMLALEPVLLDQSPDLVVTVGDVNSTLAAALVAAKLGIPVAHVEAGLRSRDRTMPEELNRILTDQLSELLFTTSRDADVNLQAEGIDQQRVHFVGNTMIDSLEAHLSQALTTSVLSELGLSAEEYAVVTLHRPSNVDDAAGLQRIAQMLGRVAERLPVVFPLHARTRERLVQFGLYDELRSSKPAQGGADSRPRVLLHGPLGYLDFLGLLANSRLVLTDSGGIQEETTVLGVPCLTLRKNTERPVTVTEGTNRLIDPQDPEALLTAVDSILNSRPPGDGVARRPELWDGQAASRIIKVIAEWTRP